MKKLYYRCSDIINEALEAEAERRHITKNQLMDSIVRKYFDIQKFAREYRKYSETEEKILAEMIVIGADVMDIRDAMQQVSQKQFNDNNLHDICMDAEEKIIDIGHKLRLIETQIRHLAD